MVHGGDIYRNQGCLDFSANINPLGMPSAVIAAAKQGVEAAIHYPDVCCEKLCQSIAEKEGIKNQWVLCGNGAADLIFGLCLALKPSKAIVLSPCFSEYEQALKTVNSQVFSALLKEEDEFKVTKSVVKDICRESADLIFLCNPNNPTGQLIGKEELWEILQHCKDTKTFLVIDECFLEFLGEWEETSLVKYINSCDHLVILKAFTKLYAMPGIRLGYLMTSNLDLLEKMKTGMQPWNVSTVAQWAGEAALKECLYIEKTKKLLYEERTYLLRNLDKLAKKVYGASANYIFFRAEEDLAEWTKSQGILIRDCSNYKGLKKGFYRIAIRTREENKRLIETWQRRRID